ncbi:MAG: methyltransferase family protein [Planctomycetaceae bacterium]|nr:methyltransferase family protein [Planctomycetaceae bacterium]
MSSNHELTSQGSAIESSASDCRQILLPLNVTAPLGSIWKVNLTSRCLRPEWMDQSGVDPQALEGALRALKRYNWLTFSYGGILTPIRELAAEQPQKQLRVLDVACGGGDIAVNLALAAKRSGLNVTVDGCDLSPTSVDVATRNARRTGVSSRFFQFDVNQDAWPTDYDIICSSLFLHHLPTPMVELVLNRMGNATRQMVIVNDLIRSRLGYLLLRYGTLLVTRSPLARYDGPISVAGAFTTSELQQLATRAGLVGATVTHYWSERMLFVWNKARTANA